MKKIVFIIFICSLLGACQVNELTEQRDINDIYARIECDIATKTIMDADNNIRWSEGDQVVAFMKSSLALKYQIKSNYVGKTSGSFSKISSESSDDLYAGMELEHNVVYYPYIDDVSIEQSGDSYVLNVLLPVEQTYSEGSFGNGSMPMLAVSEDNDITFRNVCGGVKFKFKGNKKITSIKLEGKNNELLSGTATITAYADGTNPSIEMSSDASGSVTLDCGAGVQLSEDNITEFIIALPPVVFKQGFTVSIKDAEANTFMVESDKANSVIRSSLLAMPVITLGNSGPEYPEDDDPEPIPGHNHEPYFSETVELMGLLWRLAGSGEYCQCRVGSVAQSADSFFASMRNHQAVTLAKQYRQLGICYDAVTGFANQLIFNDEANLIFDPDYLEGSNAGFDDRWTDSQKNDMLAAVNDFYKESDFHEWFASTKVEQQQAIASFKTVCDLDYTWFDSFYGKNDKISSRIILSFMIGPNNNGISLKRKDGTLLLTPVLGCLNQFSENVTFNGDMNLIVHEFSHPYCNPLIESNWSSISVKANEVYNEVRSIMESQAYGNPVTMMCETLVRSCAIRYMKSHNLENLVNQQLAYEENNGFMMVRYLVKTLEERENEAAQYSSLSDFMPVMIEAINNFDPNDPSNKGGVAEPDLLPHDYVDLGIDMGDGKKLYFATRNVGETSPAGIGTSVYKWGAKFEWGDAWYPELTYTGWPIGTRLDAAHDIATIEWGGDWHTPSPEEWNTLIEQSDYERKEAYECEYGVAGYFFYNRSDRSKYIFLPIAPWSGELKYWTSEICSPIDNICAAAVTFTRFDGEIGCIGMSGLSSSGFSVRPVIASSGEFDANGHEYVDLGLEMSDGKKLYFATMNVGETSPAGCLTKTYRWGATEDNGEEWKPESDTTESPEIRLDAAHDIATITWGEKWHVPSPEEWNLLIEKCDYERKEANESGYGVAGFFFYNKSDHSQSIFLPVATWSGELAYWSSELYGSSYSAYVFCSYDGYLSCDGTAGLDSSGFAVRPVFVE